MIISLTGGIGSGKTIVADLFTSFNITVFKSDLIIHSLIKPQTVFYEEIVKKLGNSILNEYEELNKKKLRQIIFTQPEVREWMEELLHPELYRIMVEQAKQIKDSYCVLEIPLLIEKPPPFQIDRILVIDCPIEQQIRRTMARDNITRKEAQNIIDIQIDREVRLNKASDVIVNDGSIDDLREKVHEMHKFYESLYMEMCFGA